MKRYGRWNWWVFPTHVGVFLISEDIASVRQRLPHARGGVSAWVLSIGNAVLSSPRTWGCFLVKGMDIALRDVFPTHVGVFP